MVLVRRAIDEDVNLFDRPQPAGDERARPVRVAAAADADAGRGLSRVSCSIACRPIVGEEKVGDVPYLLAAAPVRAGGREGIVTVPLTNRQQRDRSSRSTSSIAACCPAVLFSLLGAALGYWMAERIADPVNRLTRATRRIARGDLDARIAATSSDELRRLVEDFNQMAADLKRQRTELERTQRLEAWADMARQVAHDIKNPLTPIQLSAEHAQRVNIDRGRPLSPVLDECVDVDPVAGAAAPADLGRVLELRLVADAAAGTDAVAGADRGGRRAVPHRARATRIAIEVQAPPDCRWSTIDRTLFARALTNVIENALHAMPGTRTADDRQPDPRVASPTRQPSAVVVVEIADTGVGMDRGSAGAGSSSRTSRPRRPAPASA